MDRLKINRGVLELDGVKLRWVDMKEFNNTGTPEMTLEERYDLYINKQLEKQSKVEIKPIVKKAKQPKGRPVPIKEHGIPGNKKNFSFEEMMIYHEEAINKWINNFYTTYHELCNVDKDDIQSEVYEVLVRFYNWYNKSDRELTLSKSRAWMSRMIFSQVPNRLIELSRQYYYGTQQDNKNAYKIKTMMLDNYGCIKNKFNNADIQEVSDTLGINYYHARLVLNSLIELDSIQYMEEIDILDDLLIKQGTEICENEQYEVEYIEMKNSIAEALGTLTEREQMVLRLRFGLDDGIARTLCEVAKEFKVTKERLRQIEAKALRKLRHPSRSCKLKDYLD